MGAAHAILIDNICAIIYLSWQVGFIFILNQNNQTREEWARRMRLQ
jgi:hypothetical protein